MDSGGKGYRNQREKRVSNEQQQYSGHPWRHHTKSQPYPVSHGSPRTTQSRAHAVLPQLCPSPSESSSLQWASFCLTDTTSSSSLLLGCTSSPLSLKVPCFQTETDISNHVCLTLSSPFSQKISDCCRNSLVTNLRVQSFYSEQKQKNKILLMKKNPQCSKCTDWKGGKKNIVPLLYFQPWYPQNPADPASTHCDWRFVTSVDCAAPGSSYKKPVLAF